MPNRFFLLTDNRVTRQRRGVRAASLGATPLSNVSWHSLAFFAPDSGAADARLRPRISVTALHESLAPSLAGSAYFHLRTSSFIPHSEFAIRHFSSSHAP
jgi:hypothetical protein